MFDSRFLPTVMEVFSNFQKEQRTISKEQRGVLVEGLEVAILDVNCLGEYLFAIRGFTRLQTVIPNVWMKEFLQKIDSHTEDDSIHLVVQEGMDALEDESIIRLILEPASLCQVYYLTKHWLDDPENCEPSGHWMSLLQQRPTTGLDESVEGNAEEMFSPITDEFKDILPVLTDLLNGEDGQSEFTVEMNERGIVLCALEGMLTDVRWIYSYFQFMHSTYELQAPFPFTNLFPEELTDTLLEDGLDCLDNRQLAELLFNPDQLTALMNNLSARTPSSYWWKIYKIYNQDAKMATSALSYATLNSVH